MHTNHYLQVVKDWCTCHLTGCVVYMGSHSCFLSFLSSQSVQLFVLIRVSRCFCLFAFAVLFLYTIGEVLYTIGEVLYTIGEVLYTIGKFYIL